MRGKIGHIAVGISLLSLLLGAFLLGGLIIDKRAFSKKEASLSLHREEITERVSGHLFQKLENLSQEVPTIDLKEPAKTSKKPVKSPKKSAKKSAKNSAKNSVKSPKKMVYKEEFETFYQKLLEEYVPNYSSLTVWIKGEGVVFEKGSTPILKKDSQEEILNAVHKKFQESPEIQFLASKEREGVLFLPLMPKSLPLKNSSARGSIGVVFFDNLQPFVERVLRERETREIFGNSAISGWLFELAGIGEESFFLSSGSFGRVLREGSSEGEQSCLGFFCRLTFSGSTENSSETLSLLFAPFEEVGIQVESRDSLLFFSTLSLLLSFFLLVTLLFLMNVFLPSLSRKESLERVATVVDAVPIASSLVDPTTHHLLTPNLPFLQKTGYTEKELKLLTCPQLLGEETWKYVTELVTKGVLITDYATKMELKGGESTEIFLSFRKMKYEKEDIFILSFIEYGESKTRENFLAWMAQTDELTGLMNRRAFMQNLEEIFIQKKREESILLLFDIDFFKKVNDTYGHLIGDVVLREFSLLLKELLRDGRDVIGRIGGEEFGVILLDTPYDTGKIIAERIRKRVEALEITQGEHLIRITTSIGLLSTINRDFKNGSELYKEADKELYRAKNEGRNRVCG